MGETKQYLDIEGLKHVWSKVKDLPDKTSLNFNGATNKFEVKEVKSTITKTTDLIPVAGGPLADLVSKKYPDGIPAGTDLQKLLMDLLCEEKWPSIAYVNASLTSSVAVPNISMSTGTVEVGTSVAYSISCGTSSYVATPNSAKGFTYGYSSVDKDKATSEGKEMIGTKSEVTTTSTTRTLTPTGFGLDPVTAANPTLSGSHVATEGTNLVSATNTSDTYSCDFGEVPSKYIISNLRNTKGHKTNLLAGSTKTTDVKTSGSASKSFKGDFYAFVGYTASVPTTSAEVRAMKVNTKLGKVTLNSGKCNNNYMVVAVPAEWDFTIQNGLGSPTQRKAFEKTTVDVKLPNGTPKSYNVWSASYADGPWKNLTII